MELEDRVSRFIEDEGLFKKGDTICAAVSGGPDSMAMLYILFRLSANWEWKIVAAHLNHQFRGRESEREMELVRRFSGDLGLACEIGVTDVPAYIRDAGKNPQAAAREKRYEFLLNAAQKHGADKIALAHHADDQAETLMMRLIRGTGPSGLAGIPVRRKEGNVELIRPLMRIYKQELLDYCGKWNIPYLEDTSNRSRKYFRNAVRLDILPFIRQYNHKFEASLNRLADLMAGEDEFMRLCAQETIEKIGKWEAGGYCFSRSSFSSLHIALQRRVITLILNYLWKDQETGQPPWQYADVEEIRFRIIQNRNPSTSLELCKGIRLEREYDQLRLTYTPKGEVSPFFYLIPPFEHGGGDFKIPETGGIIRYRVIHLEEQCRPLSSPHKAEAFFDLDRLCLPLSVRSRRPGDRMEVLGLNGSKKVKNIFIDEKLPPSQRNRIPLLCDAEGKVLWIPGVRRSRHGLVDKGTTRILHLEYLSPGSHSME